TPSPRQIGIVSCGISAHLRKGPLTLERYRVTPPIPKPSEKAMHHEHVGETEPRVPKRARHTAYDAKPVFLPEPDGDFVADDDHIELHPAKTGSPSDTGGVLAESAADPAASRLWRHHVACVGDVISQPDMVGSQGIGTDKRSVLFGRKTPRRRRRPDRPRLFTRDRGIVDVRVARSHDVTEDRPDPVELVRSDLPDFEVQTFLSDLSGSAGCRPRLQDTIERKDILAPGHHQ